MPGGGANALAWERHMEADHLLCIRARRGPGSTAVWFCTARSRERCGVRKARSGRARSAGGRYRRRFGRQPALITA
jgi:hypothetical protein